MRRRRRRRRRRIVDLTIGDIVPLTGDLSDFGPPGRKAADLAVDQIKQAIEGGRRRPHRQDRARGRPDRPAGRRAGGPQGGRRGERDLHRGRLGIAPDTIPIARVGLDPRGRAQISPARRPTRSPTSRTTASCTARPRRTASRARRWPTSSRTRWAARRARRSTSAPATTPTAPAWPTRSPRPGRPRAAGRQERPLRPRAAELQLGGPADRVRQPGRLGDHRLPRDLREDRPGAGAHGQLGPGEDVHRRRPGVAATCPRTPGARRPRACAAPLPTSLDGAGAEAFDALCTARRRPGRARPTTPRTSTP